MLKFRKADGDILNDLDAYLRQIGDEPVKWFEREVKTWGEFGYDELSALIASGDTALIDWQARYAQAVNEKFNPLWLAAIRAASHAATRGRITIDDSDVRVKEFLRQRAAEFVQNLSDESKRAVANVILYGQSQHLAPRDIAKLVRPLIGLNSSQAQANVAYRQKIFQRLTDAGLSTLTATQRADKAAAKYAAKQHRFRAETIVHTELARAYNRGIYDGVKAAVDARLMNHCEIIWSTAGTNRVCGRCLSLKDTVVGRTDEVGVQIPPLHPRCRCVIICRETARLPVSGALNNRNDPTYERRDKQAREYYERVRTTEKLSFVQNIARNSGMSEQVILEICEHVFERKHQLRGGFRRFDPDYDMTESFRRLSEGKDVQPHDLILLKHERLELGLMRRYGYDYDTAHRITERKYSYDAALTRWLKERGDW